VSPARQDEAVDAAKAVGGDAWMVKAQIHAGGRGKAGWREVLQDLRRGEAERRGNARHEDGDLPVAGVALPVDCVLVAQATDIAKELYLSVLVDRSSKSLTFIASAEGGVEIEKVAERNPDAIKTLHVNFVQGLQPYQCRELGFALWPQRQAGRTS
jgi:succinyl-CoA synthetase beta subunit